MQEIQGYRKKADQRNGEKSGGPHRGHSKKRKGMYKDDLPKVVPVEFKASEGVPPFTMNMLSRTQSHACVEFEVTAENLEYLELACRVAAMPPVDKSVMAGNKVEVSPNVTYNPETGIVMTRYRKVTGKWDRKMRVIPRELDDPEAVQTLLERMSEKLEAFRAQHHHPKDEEQYLLLTWFGFPSVVRLRFRVVDRGHDLKCCSIDLTHR